MVRSKYENTESCFLPLCTSLLDVQLVDLGEHG